MLQPTTPDATCDQCGRGFLRFNSMQRICGRMRCTVRVAKQAGVARKAAIRERREKLKTRSEWLKETQEVVNAYIVRRDAALPCVSCGCLHSPMGWNASHYRSVGSSPALRFDPANIHRACVRCNLHLHGNPIPYRVELLKRIGAAEVERLEGPQPTMKYSVDELKALKVRFRQQAKEMET